MAELPIRRMTSDDAEVIAHQRVMMLVDMEEASLEQLEPMRQAFIPWVREKLAQEIYLGWCAYDGQAVVAGAGLLIYEWPPVLIAPHPHQRGYAMNVYTEPAYRGRGLARRLMETMIDWCSERHLPLLFLHASDAGRPIYEDLGFELPRQPEMRLRLPR